MRTNNFHLLLDGPVDEAKDVKMQKCTVSIDNSLF